MSEPDFQVNVETLGQVSRGVRDAVGSLTEMGSWGSDIEATLGQGLTYAVSNLDTGHGELASASEAAGEAWDYGLRHQIKDGEAASDKIDEAAAKYRDMDRDAAERLAQIETGGDVHGQQ